MAKPTFERGRQITASALNAVVDMIVKRIRGGRGISVKRAGDGIIISSDGSARGGGGRTPLNDADGVMNSVASNTSNYAGSVDVAARADHTHAFYYEEVSTLPAIPTTKGGAIVIYDGQMWSASEGDTRWYPMVKFDSESGAPPA